MGDYGLSISMRELLARQPIRPDAERGLWRRVQDLHETSHDIQMEG